MKFSRLLAVAALLGFATVHSSFAAPGQAGPGAGREIKFNASTESPLDKRIRWFAYSQDMVYDLVIKASDQHTHIRLAPDEQLTEKPKLGDTTQWRLAGNEKNLYVKALVPGLSTSVSLVTNKRIYQFQMRSSDSVKDTVQMVYFQYPDDEERFEASRREFVAAAAQTVTNRVEREQRTLRPALGVDVQNLTLYELKGDLPFKVRTMFADNKFTYLEVPPNTQDLPAIFITGPDRKAIPVNYTVDGSWIIIERVEPVFEMRLGSLKLVATAIKKDK